ncbi:MAG: flagellar export chaperone FlgN [Phycisphaerales bacterium]
MNTTASLARDLERQLRELLGEHRRLVSLARQHRAALRSADGRAVTSISIERDAVNERIVRLNEQRNTTASAIAEALGLDASNGGRRATVRALVESLSEPEASRLAAVADELRAAIESTQREHSVLRDATAAIAGHLGGVLTQVLSAYAPSKTYTARGRVSVSVALVGSLDVRH